MRRVASVFALLLFVVAIGWWQQRADLPASDTTASPTPAADAAVPVSRPAETSPYPDFLPREARHTLRLIARGGPFPHRQDGTVFGNRERRLPSKPHGYYREYTVDTPGLNHRGAKRIVTGGQPPAVYYYTDDHYDSFRRFDMPDIRESSREPR